MPGKRLGLLANCRSTTCRANALGFSRSAAVLLQGDGRLFVEDRRTKWRNLRMLRRKRRCDGPPFVGGRLSWAHAWSVLLRNQRFRGGF